MKKFTKNFLLFIFPLLLPIILYIYLDPFKVIRSYEEPVNTNKPYFINYNRDYQTTELFLKNYPVYKYNAFILGNSRTLFYDMKQWNSFTGANGFHFNSYFESLYGIQIKLQLLDRMNVKIDHALINLDNTTLRTANDKGYLLVKHPITSGESWFSFHYEMFSAFASKAMRAHLDLALTGTKKPYMDNFGIQNNVWKHDTKTNELRYYVYDEMIQKNPDSYYKDKINMFYKRDTIQKFADKEIHAAQRKLLESVKSILIKHKTDFRIVMNPVYEQLRTHPDDRKYLDSLFGSEHIYDFSGINNLTSEYRNYYETIHYRPNVCDSMLRVIYKKD